ncbi:MAG: alpha/beta fold hydrolase [Roseiflexaceae bacterium]
MIIEFIVGVLLLIAPYLLITSRETNDPASLLSNDMRHVMWNGVAIAVRERGNGPVIVLIHGFGSWLDSWQRLHHSLVGAGFRVIAIDMVGAGASTRSLNPAHYTTASQARMVLDVLESMGVGRVSLIGHSYGGRVALQMAVFAPERIIDIVALAPEVRALTRPPISKILTIPVLGYALAFWSTAPRLMRLGLASVSVRKDWLTPERVASYAAPVHVRSHLVAQITQASAPKDGDMPVPLHYRHITVPVQLIWGQNDAVFPPTDGLALVDEMQNCSIAIIPNCGHIPHEEAFNETWALLLQTFPARTVMLQTYR